VVKFLKDIIKDNPSQNSFLNSLSLPEGITITTLYDSKYKKLFLFGFVLTIIFHR
jgi:hypothetical protein